MIDSVAPFLGRRVAVLGSPFVETFACAYEGIDGVPSHVLGGFSAVGERVVAVVAHERPAALDSAVGA